MKKQLIKWGALLLATNLSVTNVFAISNQEFLNEFIEDFNKQITRRYGESSLLSEKDIEKIIRSNIKTASNQEKIEIYNKVMSTHMSNLSMLAKEMLDKNGAVVSEGTSNGEYKYKSLPGNRSWSMYRYFDDLNGKYADQYCGLGLPAVALATNKQGTITKQVVFPKRYKDLSQQARVSIIHNFETVVKGIDQYNKTNKKVTVEGLVKWFDYNTNSDYYVWHNMGETTKFVVKPHSGAGYSIIINNKTSHIERIIIQDICTTKQELQQQIGKEVTSVNIGINKYSGKEVWKHIIDITKDIKIANPIANTKSELDINTIYKAITQPEEVLRIEDNLQKLGYTLTSIIQVNGDVGVETWENEDESVKIFIKIHYTYNNIETISITYDVDKYKAINADNFTHNEVVGMLDWK